MRASIIIPVFAAAVFAQSESSQSGDDFPQTSYLTQTNSLGVVTGQPGVETSIPDQPPADTSIPDQPPVNTAQPSQATDVGVPASLPALGSGIYTIPVQGTAGPNSTQTLVVSANNSTTVVLSQQTPKPSGSDASGTGANPTETGGDGEEETGTPTGSDAPSSSAAAATMRAIAGSVAGVGALMAAFL